MVEYITGLQAGDVPWNRLISSYGWASDFPALLESVESSDGEAAVRALDTLSDEIEHQDTLWPCTPFALVFLYKHLLRLTDRPDGACSGQVAEKIIEAMDMAAHACRYAFSLEHAEPLPRFSDMLDEKYLLPGGLQDNDDVYACIEDGFDIPDELFFSIYYYSCEILKLAVPLCEQAGKKILLPEA